MVLMNTNVFSLLQISPANANYGLGIGKKLLAQVPVFSVGLWRLLPYFPIMQFQSA